MASNVYLIHISPPYRHAGHYCGYTTREDEAERLDEHRTGRGAVLCRHAVRAGSVLVLARVWRNVPRRFELRVKGHGMARVCPICDPLALRRLSCD